MALKIITEMTDKELEAERKALRDAGANTFVNGKWQEGTPEQQKRAEELSCIDMINSKIAYGDRDATAEEILDKDLNSKYHSYLKQYVDKLGRERVLELIQGQLDDIDTVVNGTFTDSEGVTYNSIRWKREAFEKRYSEKRNLKEASDNKMPAIGEIARYLEDGVNFMQSNQEYTLYKYNLNDKYVIAMYWAEGFDPDDQATLILDESNNGLVVGIKLRNDSEWDGNYLNFPTDEDDNILVEESAIARDEDFNVLAKYLLDDYKTVMDLEND